MENFRGLDIDLKIEIATLGELVIKMQELEERKEKAILIVREKNKKFDKQLNDLISENNSLREEKDNLKAIRKELLDKLNKIYWFMFWRFLEKNTLDKQLESIDQRLSEIDSRLNENILDQWEVKPNFENECREALDGIELYFLNVGMHYIESNDEEVRKRIDQDNKGVLEEYKSTIITIILKCIEYIKGKVRFEPNGYEVYYKIDINSILELYEITPNIFQNDILLRIDSFIDNLLNPSTINLDKKEPQKAENDDIKKTLKI